MVIDNIGLASSEHEGNTVVWWTSGEADFLKNLRGVIQGAVHIMWVTRSARRTPKSTPSEQWYSLTHSNVGGVTNARGVFGVIGLSVMSIPTDLPRFLSHIIKYSIRPTPCDLNLTLPHYKVTDRLVLSRLTQPVLMTSRFSHSGWGYRPLEDCELEAAFELPDGISWDPSFVVDTVPLQLCRSVMEEVLGQLAPPGRMTEEGCPKRAKVELPPPAMGDTSEFHWLPSIGRWLSGSWTHTSIADRAVKADSAAIDFFPWNQRIQLVFPHVTAHLIRKFERAALNRWRRNLYRSFIRYLEHQYGTHWAQRLRRSRELDRSAKRDGAEWVSPLPKRRKTGATRTIKKGGWPLAGAEMDQDLFTDVKKGMRVLSQAYASTWWEWTQGSSLVFWRWNGEDQRRSARDGMTIFSTRDQEQSPTPKPRFSPSDATLVAAKMDIMMNRSYLETGFVKAKLHYFGVAKGDSDIRVVFDGTSSGLNSTLWAPNFFLPTSRDAAMLLTYNTWMADVDFGEMFHNFFMDGKLRKCAGVDLGPVSKHMKVQVPASSHGHHLARWTRLFMGMRSSPYNAVRYYYLGEEFVRGDPKANSNPMRYDRIRWNLPCMAAYDPGLPKVMKWNDQAMNNKGGVAGDVITFVDDGRITGFSKENCHEVHRRFASRIQFLGMQDAPRKFRPPSQLHAGAWTGTIFRINDQGITKSVSQEKWDKARSIVQTLRIQCHGDVSGRPKLNRKELEQSTGFLNHLAMTFDDMTPFLKGLYLTLNAWRPGRDADDWKMTDAKWKQVLFDQHDRLFVSGTDLDLNPDDPKAPVLVVGSTRLSGDVEALTSILESVTVPCVVLHSKRIISVVYGFGDASGTGLGATFTCGAGFNFRIGVWGTKEADESSNWKEFSNVVEALEDEAVNGNLVETEVFMFTDNATVEACSTKGSSSSPKLLGLIIRLRAMATRSGIKLHIFHVAGTRMIAQGTDGVSRGYLANGVMAGEAMSAYIPIHLSAVDRSSELIDWMKSWCGLEAIEMKPSDWFSEGHDIAGWRMDYDGFERPVLKEGRTYLWFPPLLQPMLPWQNYAKPV